MCTRLPRAFSILGCLLLACFVHKAANSVCADEPQQTAPQDDQRLSKRLRDEVLPLLQKHCHECHGPDRSEGEIDFNRFATLDAIRGQSDVWQKIEEVLATGQMPPPDAKPMDEQLRLRLHQWVRDFLQKEANARAGDPGPVVLRRLNNAEYTYTLRDLTGVESLSPAHEFPVDSAAGEGFTNVGSALVMSPSLLTKYVDAAKGVAEHLVLLPSGVRFSPFTTQRDWTDEYLAMIRSLYGRYSSSSGGSAVNLQGIQFDTNRGGRLSVDPYLEALLSVRDTVAPPPQLLDGIARQRGLSPKYLLLLWEYLSDRGERALLDSPSAILRQSFRDAGPGDAKALAQWIEAWQAQLWRFNSIGHIGLAAGPKAWQEPISPLVNRQTFRLKCQPTSETSADRSISIYLSATDAGDGNAADWVIWQRPRFEIPGQPDLLLRDVERVSRAVAAQRSSIFEQSAGCLRAAAEVQCGEQPDDRGTLAARHQVTLEALNAWFSLLGIGSGSDSAIGMPLVERLEGASGYPFIRGWVGADALSVLANSSDQHVRIPGNMPPHSVGVHPAPNRAVVVTWIAPCSDQFQVNGFAQHAHPECGNGVSWAIELQRGSTRQVLSSGTSAGDRPVQIALEAPLAIRAGERIALVIGPREGNHSCDLTTVDLELASNSGTWKLSRDVAADLLSGNPHADFAGRKGIWHFTSIPVSDAERSAGFVVPVDSLLARWQLTPELDQRFAIADAIHQLLNGSAAEPPSDSPDAQLLRLLRSLRGPLLGAALAYAAEVAANTEPSTDGNISQFGFYPQLGTLDAGDICVQAPATLHFEVGADLLADSQFVVDAVLAPNHGKEGCVQVAASLEPLQLTGLSPTLPILVSEGSDQNRRWESELDEFRGLFPPALCYSQIVPVDEVITLTLFHREDEPLQRLMLTDEEKIELDRLWEELRFVSEEPIARVTAYEQIVQFATQDRPDLVEALEIMRQPITESANRFRQQLVDAEPDQRQAVIAFAERAYRRPLSAAERADLESLYTELRADGLSHADATRMLLTRTLVSPAFLYRAERSPSTEESASVTDHELASRLSYFLWSSTPDAELLTLAHQKRLHDPQVLSQQVHRMLQDPKLRRLASEFALQWLHLYGFEHTNEKSERHFPTFAGLRGAMQEETVLFFSDLFANDRSLLQMLDADYTWLNQSLAEFYGIPGVEGDAWTRISGVRSYGRGGILTQASVLSKHSGASRTSPILRGNWLSEVVLGEKLPRPPKNVPPLADAVPAELTEREATERHSSDPACAKCHARVDPFGFALEQFDAIGRFRTHDLNGRPINAFVRLPDGTELEGMEGLREYLMSKRRDAFLRQFTRKLLGYALGRSVLLSDQPLLDEIQAKLEATDYRFSVLVESIVLSRQFREVRGLQESPLEGS
jgi:hypothetical protein